MVALHSPLAHAHTVSAQVLLYARPPVQCLVWRSVCALHVDSVLTTMMHSSQVQPVANLQILLGAKADDKHTHAWACMTPPQSVVV
jgi:hypothetical protein